MAKEAVQSRSASLTAGGERGSQCGGVLPDVEREIPLREIADEVDDSLQVAAGQAQRPRASLLSRLPLIREGLQDLRRSGQEAADSGEG